MTTSRNRFSTAGLILGAVALLAAVSYFWAGPFTPAPPLEQVVADKAVAIRDTTIAKLMGRDVSAAAPESRWTTDRIFIVGTASVGAIALILGVFGFARRESSRICLSAAALGAAAVVFQFVAAAIGGIIVIVVIFAILASFGLG